MKKSVVIGYKVVPMSEVSPMAQSADPANSGRVPIGTILQADKDLHYVPATGTMAKPWQAVIGTNGDDGFPISPRVFMGFAYVDKKLVQVSERNFPKKPLIDLLKSGIKFRVTGYPDVQVDDFESKELVTKAFPSIELVLDGEEDKPANKANKAKNA